jgi:hypothetical protein
VVAAPQNRDGALAICVFALTATLVCSPLLWQHLTDPEIGKRAHIQGWIWSPADSLGGKIGKVLDRYQGHFGLEFLFVRGDQEPGNAPPAGTGLIHWYELPLMLMGLVACLRTCKRSRAVRLLLAWIVLYPVGDLFSAHGAIHSLRSLPGLGGLTLLVFVGGATVGKWLWQPHRRWVPAIATVTVIVVTILTLRYFQAFFDKFPRRLYYESLYGADIMEATEWVRPSLREADAMFVTGKVYQPYIFTLLGLKYDPQQWLNDKREIRSETMPNGTAGFDVYRSFGKIYLMMGDYPPALLDEFTRNRFPDRLIFILRPGELGLEKWVKPVHEIRGPNGYITI